MSPLTSVDDALVAVLARAERLDAEDVPVARALGRVLAADVVAMVDLPRFPSSAMDGFTLRAVDVPARLPIVGRIAAGRPSAVELGAGEAMGIATGGVVPRGADAVVPIEDAVELDGWVELPAVPVGANVRPAGGDVRAGAIAGRLGSVVGPARLAALAASGAASVLCGRQPRVAVLTTGTELRPPGASLAEGEIYESNGPMLAALLGLTGARVTVLDPVSDDAEAHRVALSAALESDVVVTSGGVSVGPHDLVRPTLAALGVEEVFWGVSMRPGKPLSFGVRGGTLVFGLPGNPVSSYVSALLFVVPALLALQGAIAPGPSFQRGALATEVTPRPSRDDFQRASFDRDGRLVPLARQESHMIVEAADAVALVRVPAGTDTLPAGAAVDYLRLDLRPSGA
jgi:molybdopterin molybdotransferase